MEKQQIIEILNKAYFSENPHEEALQKRLNPFVQLCQTFVDVGASLGQYTLYANTTLKKGQIISIEADPIRYDQLKINGEKWASEGSNSIDVVHAAASDKTGDKITFFSSNSNISGGLIPHDDFITKGKINWQEVSVNSLTLDDLKYRNKPESSVFVKMDIEGAEYLALLGAKNLLKGDNYFFIELHDFAKYDNKPVTELVKGLMKANGYHGIYFDTLHVLFLKLNKPLARKAYRSINTKTFFNTIAQKIKHKLGKKK